MRAEDGPRVSWRTLTIVLLFVDVALLIALGTAVAAPLDRLAVVALVLAIVSLFLQIAFYIGQETASRRTDVDSARFQTAVTAQLDTIKEVVPASIKANLVEMLQLDRSKESRSAAGPVEAATTAPRAYSPLGVLVRLRHGLRHCDPEPLALGDLATSAW